MKKLVLALFALLLNVSTALAQTVVVEYYHTDPLGSVRAVTDQAGIVTRRHDFFPFGIEYAAPPPDVKRWHTGKKRDAETGLYYLGRVTTQIQLVDLQR